MLTINICQVYSGQIVGVYDETKFMWNPTEFNTITIFSCTDATQPLARFRLELVSLYRKE